MKNLLIFFLSGYLFSQAVTDTSRKFPLFNLSKGLNIPGLIPNNLPMDKNSQLILSEIEEIKQKAKDFIPEPVTKDDIVVMETNRGTMKIKLFPAVAPKHCRNFKKLANSTFYDGTTFHRIIPGFMIQGGDINSRDNNPNNDGEGGPGWSVDAEFNEVLHRRGTLSMARASDPNSAGSQFFICVEDAPHLDGKYTVFGKVISGMDVIDQIASANTPKRENRMYQGPDGDNPFECLLDCPAELMTLDPTEDANGYCEVMVAADLTCLDDCSEEMQAGFNNTVMICEMCIPVGNCADYFDGL